MFRNFNNLTYVTKLVKLYWPSSVTRLTEEGVVAVTTPAWTCCVNTLAQQQQQQPAVPTWQHVWCLVGVGKAVIITVCGAVHEGEVLWRFYDCQWPPHGWHSLLEERQQQTSTLWLSCTPCVCCGTVRAWPSAGTVTEGWRQIVWKL